MRNYRLLKKYLPKPISGFSMIELFIAITIGLFLLAAVLQIFLNARNSYYIENGTSGLQENTRFVHEYVTRIIRMAGYRTPPTTGNNFQAMTTIFPTATTPYVSGSSGTGFNNSDVLVIRYQGSGNGTGTPDGTVRDCLNNAADSNTMVTNTFSLSNNYELQCQAVNANSGASGTTQVLVSGVEDFKVLYGEEVNNDNAADRYVPANYAFLNFGDVVSVRISMILRSDSQVRPFSNAVTYNLLGTTYTSPADKYLRTQLTYTVLLRNLVENPL